MPDNTSLETSDLGFLSEVDVKKLTGLTNKQRRVLEMKGEFPMRVPMSDRLHAYDVGEFKQWRAKKLRDREAVLMARRSPNPLAKRNRQRLAAGG